MNPCPEGWVLHAQGNQSHDLMLGELDTVGSVVSLKKFKYLIWWANMLNVFVWIGEHHIFWFLFLLGSVQMVLWSQGLVGSNPEFRSFICWATVSITLDLMGLQPRGSSRFVSRKLGTSCLGPPFGLLRIGWACSLRDSFFFFHPQLWVLILFREAVSLLYVGQV